MKFLKNYTNIKNFLYRFTILQVGSLHIRIHKLTSDDQSSLYHNHPFNYISIILKGGYTEKLINRKSNTKSTRIYKAPCILIRNSKLYHRLENVSKPTITLFISFGKYQWNAINTIESPDPDGIFERTINNKFVWSKRINGIWFIGNQDYVKALTESRHSIYQV